MQGSGRVSTFASNESGSTFECQLDGVAFAACTSPYTRTGLADGAHTFAVRATDPVGHVDPTPAGRSWTVDTVPPDTTITGGPSGKVATRTASFTFSSSESGSTLTCQLGGGDFAPCSSPKTYAALKDGRHTFNVQANDAAGNADPSGASRIWTVDRTGPNASFFVPKQLLGVALGKGFKFRVASNEAGTFRLVLLVKGKVVATLKGRFTVNGQKLVVVKVSAKSRRALRRARAVSFTARLESKDTLGNASRFTRPFKLRR